MKLYRTIKGDAVSEQVIDRSRFICHMTTVNTKEEADSYIASIRQKYKDATHNVPAFIVGNKMEMKWQSDDSEPQGTAGAPMLEVLSREGITNVVAVVTRYFGGIKLGTGGLVRAYQSSVKLALQNSVICDATEVVEISVRVDYNTYQKIEKLKSDIFEITDREFTDTVLLRLTALIENKAELLSFITNMSNGKAIVENTEEKIFLKNI
ncbi:MAG: YigZ family protein [Clostridia bacterium]|nr:YigZ family protein [Clostridia bacterium]